MCAPKTLHGLIREAGLDDEPLTPEEGNALQSGVWLPLLSLPGLLGVSPERPLISAPYLRSRNDRIEAWRSRLAAEQRPIIAINWQGNPDHEQTTSRGRSLPLEAFAPLASLTGISLLSLQKGPGSEQLDACSFRDRLVSCQSQVDAAWDFVETAAILANCDLVITSDTAVAHLAGGMGRRTWLLLKNVPEWRWGLTGDTTFWYDSMRLFRQTRRGDWTAVIARVVGTLKLAG
jgi:ADP-heptose:LPS heptosyltransferase